MTAHIKVGGTWKEINPKVKVSGAWKNLDSGWVRVSGTWRQFYSAGFSGIANWLIGLNSGELQASQDGITFQKIANNPFGISSINDVAYLNNEFWAVANDAVVARSTNGIAWTTVNIGGTNNYSNINFGNSIYYAAGT